MYTCYQLKRGVGWELGLRNIRQQWRTTKTATDKQHWACEAETSGVWENIFHLFRFSTSGKYNFLEFIPQSLLLRSVVLGWILVYSQTQWWLTSSLWQHQSSSQPPPSINYGYAIFSKNCNICNISKVTSIKVADNRFQLILALIMNGQFYHFWSHDPITVITKQGMVITFIY